MANEILKDELLSEEQLDGVNGGSWIESYGIDLKHAYDRKLPGFENLNPGDVNTAAYCLKNWTSGDNVVGKLKDMFAGYGIDMKYNGKPFEKNIYSYNGKQITEDQAWNIIDGKL